jgi:hypothetical protein
MKWAAENGVSGDFKDIKESKVFHDAVMASMMQEHKKGGLSSLEKLVGLAFLTEPVDARERMLDCCQQVATTSGRVHV